VKAWEQEFVVAPPESLVASPTTRHADVVTGALVRAGVGHWFIAPGSRSTPLVLSVARRGLAHDVLIDERVAGFCAVGAARVGVVAAIITTSGTAVANLLPACCEADADELPWVACTADRPQRDVELGANQTLGQQALLAGPCRQVLDLDVPAPDPGADAARETELETNEAIGAVALHLHGPGRGPIHVNVRLDKPLEPPAGWQTLPVTSGVALKPSDADADVDDVDDDTAGAIRAALSMANGLVVCGSLAAAERGPVQVFIEELGWPVIADVTSGVVVSTALPRLSTVALRAAAVREALAPQQVLWLGGLLTEDTVAQWLRQRRVPVLHVQGGRRRRDPFELATQTLVLSSLSLLATFLPTARPVAGTLSQQVHRVMAALSTLSDLVLAGPLSEPAVAKLVVSSARAGDVVFLGNSMPVRDADRFAVVGPGVTIISNRGVSGIDGCVATGLGAALASGRPVTVFLGDLAFLHDLSGVTAVAQANAAVRIVVVNNGGGGIFSFLPVAGGGVDAAQVERYFGTPHSLALSPIARALGLHQRICDDVDSLRLALADSPQRPEVIEVCTNRIDNTRRHRLLDDEVDRRCAAALAGMPS
jgi:2-succinyl-5-enolpyruvyl-6-hydroxy-3-cyclohexene-1-carboxylate synthase